MVVTWVASSVDLYPEQVGVSLADVRTFRKDLGGSATNVAVAAARLGRRSAVIAKVADDGFGLHPAQLRRLRRLGRDRSGFCGHRSSSARSICRAWSDDLLPSYTPRSGGSISVRPVLAGLHHVYERAA
jgi:pfkB family carbohydrate kinase.